MEAIQTKDMCQVCGKNEGRTHSGVIECSVCWEWRKLGRMEARFWTEGIDKLFVNENGSGPDLNDLMRWDSWGIKEDMSFTLKNLRNLHDRYHQQLIDHGLSHKCVFAVNLEATETE